MYLLDAGDILNTRREFQREFLYNIDPSFSVPVPIASRWYSVESTLWRIAGMMAFEIWLPQYGR